MKFTPTVFVKSRERSCKTQKAAWPSKQSAADTSSEKISSHSDHFGVFKRQKTSAEAISARRLARNLTTSLGLSTNETSDVVDALLSKPTGMLLGQSRETKVKAGKWEPRIQTDEKPNTSTNDHTNLLNDQAPISLYSNFPFAPNTKKPRLRVKSTFQSRIYRDNPVVTISQKTSSSETRALHNTNNLRLNQENQSRKPINWPYFNQVIQEFQGKLLEEADKRARLKEASRRTKLLPLTKSESFSFALESTTDPSVKKLQSFFKSNIRQNTLLTSHDPEQTEAVLSRLQKESPGRIINILPPPLLYLPAPPPLHPSNGRPPAPAAPPPPPPPRLEQAPLPLSLTSIRRPGLPPFASPKDEWKDDTGANVLPSKEWVDVKRKRTFTPPFQQHLTWTAMAPNFYDMLRKKAGLKPIQPSQKNDPLIIYVADSTKAGIDKLEASLSQKGRKNQPTRYILRSHGNLAGDTDSPSFASYIIPPLKKEDWLTAIQNSEKAKNFAQTWNVNIKVPAYEKLIEGIFKSNPWSSSYTGEVLDGKPLTSERFFKDFDKFGRFLYEQEKLSKEDGSPLDKPYTIELEDVEQFLEIRYPSLKDNTLFGNPLYGRSKTLGNSSSSETDSVNEGFKEIRKTVCIPNHGNVDFSKLTKNLAPIKAALEKVYTQEKYPKRMAFLREKTGYTPRMYFLLNGPPGNGKTSAAQATAQDLANKYGKNVEFLATNGSALSLGAERGASAGLRNVARLFKKIEKIKGPGVILIDEADNLMGDIGSDINHVLGKTMTAGSRTLQTEMDRVNKQRSWENRLYFFLATNYRDQIPEALTSRARYQFTLGNPNFEERQEFFALKLPEKAIQNLEPIVKALAKITEGKDFSRRDLDDLVQDLQEHLWEKESNKSDKELDLEAVRQELKPTIDDVQTVFANFRKKPVDTTEAERRKVINEATYQQALYDLKHQTRVHAPPDPNGQDYF